MKNGWKIVAAIAMLLTIIGCSARKQAPLVAVVDKIEVTGNHQDEAIHRTYTQSPKITAVLNYLRWLRPQYKADCDPEMIPGDAYTITVTLSDGTQEVYNQKTNGYLRKDTGRWENIDPAKGAMLYEIVSQIESDGQAETMRAWWINTGATVPGLPIPIMKSIRCTIL